MIVIHAARSKEARISYTMRRTVYAKARKIGYRLNLEKLHRNLIRLTQARRPMA